MRRLSVIVILIFEQLAQLRTLHFQILAALAALILGAIWVCNNPQTWWHQLGANCPQVGYNVVWYWFLMPQTTSHYNKYFDEDSWRSRFADGLWKYKHCHIFLTLFHQTRIPLKNEWVEILIIFGHSKRYIRYVRNHFSWSKSFPFGRGIPELVRNALSS